MVLRGVTSVYEFPKIRKQTKHKVDWYVMVVLKKNKKNEITKTINRIMRKTKQNKKLQIGYRHWCVCYHGVKTKKKKNKKNIGDHVEEWCVCVLSSIHSLFGVVSSSFIIGVL